MPSHVLASLIRMRSRLVPCLSYSSISCRAFAIAALGVEAETRVHFRRDAARDDLENLAAEGDGEVIHERFGARRSGAADAVRRLQRRVDQRPVLRLLRGLEQQRRVGRRVLRPILGNGVDVARVGDDGGVALERVEQGHRDRILRVGIRRAGVRRQESGVRRSGQSGIRDQRRGSLVALSFEAILQRCRQAPQHPPDFTQVAQTAVHVGGRGEAESFSNLQLRQQLTF